MTEAALNLNQENFLEQVFRFRDRQAGISLIYDPDDQVFSYNAYCLEIVLMKELFTIEFDFLDDAIDLINSEFGNWTLQPIVEEKKGCSTCVAK